MLKTATGLTNIIHLQENFTLAIYGMALLEKTASILYIR
jgi:hypothetical protein